MDYIDNAIPIKSKFMLTQINFYPKLYVQISDPEIRFLLRQQNSALKRHRICRDLYQFDLNT